MDEIWKNIKGYEGLYQVSDRGNVRSLNWRGTRSTRNLYLKPHNRGYLQVELTKDGTRRCYMVHRLVAFHFVKGYKDGLVVNHINENKIDNRASNLEWISQSENAKYSLGENLKLNRRSRKKGVARKRTESIFQMDLDGNILREWDTAVEIKQTLGYHDWSISECCRGKRHTAYGYRWRYATEYNSQERL